MPYSSHGDGRHYGSRIGLAIVCPDDPLDDHRNAGLAVGQHSIKPIGACSAWSLADGRGQRYRLTVGYWVVRIW
jgi:hypothetical protein